jgi:putative Ca2+/H+ antiporter (TMEM165/GDT1 family)
MRSVMWAFDPFFIWGYWLCLLAIAATAVLKVAGLMAVVGFRTTARRAVTLDAMVVDRSPPELVAKAALRHGVASKVAGAATSPSGDADVATASTRAALADAHFDVRWTDALARVRLTQDLFRLIALLALLVTLLGFIPEWERAGHFGDHSGVTTILLAAHFLLGRLSAGVALCVGLCLVSAVYEGVLLRRRAEWRLLRSMAQSELRRRTGRHESGNELT